MRSQCDLIYYIWSDSGFYLCFKNKNKMDIIQNLIIHDVIGWRKIALDQLANGLEVLGFRDEMKQHIDHFEELFLGKEKLTATNVLNTLSFQDKLNADEKKTKQLLLWYLENSSNEQLKNFLVLSTGAPVIPVFGMRLWQNNINLCINMYEERNHSEGFSE